MIKLTFILDKVNRRSGIHRVICLIPKPIQCHLLALNVKKFFLDQDVVDLVTEEKYFRQHLEGNNTNWVDGENERGCGTLY